MAIVLPLRSTSTPLTGPLTTETPGEIRSTPLGAAWAIRHNVVATIAALEVAAAHLFSKPGLISFQNVRAFIDYRTPGRLFVFRIITEHQLNRTVHTPRREFGDALDGAYGRGMDLL